MPEHNALLTEARDLLTGVRPMLGPVCQGEIDELVPRLERGLTPPLRVVEDTPLRVVNERERETFVCSCAGACATLTVEIDTHPFDDDDEHTWLELRHRSGGPGRLRRAWTALRGRDLDIDDLLLTRADANRLHAFLGRHL